MDVQRATRFLHRWLALLVLGMLLAGLTGYFVAGRIPPVFEASTTLLVQPGGPLGSMGVDDLQSAEQIARTYVEIIRSRPVLEEAAQQVGFTGSVVELRERIGTRLVSGTQLLRISAEGGTAEEAARLANAVAEVYIARNEESQTGRFASSRESLARMVERLRTDVDNLSQRIETLRNAPPSPERNAELARLESEFAPLQATYSDTVRTYEELRVSEARSTNSLVVIESAQPPLRPVWPNVLQATLLALVGGLGVAAAAAFVFEYFDDGLYDRARVAAATGLVTLGLIPRVKSNEQQAGGRGELSSAGDYRLLLSNIQAMTSDMDLRSIMVTSAAPSDGKSTVAANLAVALADAGQQVILVLADLHRPARLPAFNVSNRSGLSTLLLNPGQPASSQLQVTHVPGLHVLAAGPTPSDPSALFATRRVGERMEELRTLGDVVVFDSPPLLASPDAALLGPHMDGVLLVVNAAGSRAPAVVRAVAMLRQAGARVLGVVLNRVPRETLDRIAYADYESPVPAEERISSEPMGSDQPAVVRVTIGQEPGR